MLHLMQQQVTRTVVTAAGGAGGGVSADGNLAVNGDFETGKPLVGLHL
jgi:hypothetical protein